jgi:lysylphosphatidylglycerol synthetase-like protein (DUF2156 family)
MRRWLAERRTSVALAALLLVATFVTGSVLRGPRAGLRDRLGTGIDAFHETHNLLSPITSVFIASSPIELLLSLAAILLAVGAAERLMGHWRTLLAFLVTAVVGATTGMLLQAAGLMAREVWAVRIREMVVFDPFTAIAGTLLTASAFAGPLWRRRIRLLGFATLIIVFLYSGQPSDLFRIIAALAGLLLGMLLAHRSTTAAWSRSSHHEARSLLAVLLMITAVGPFVSIFSPARFGPLHPLGLLFRDQLPRMTAARAHCVDALATHACSVELALARLNGPGLVLLAPLPLIVLLVAALGMLRGRRSAAVVAIAINGLLALLAAFYYGFLPEFGGRELVSDNATGVESVVRLTVSVLVPVVIAVLIAVNLRHFTVRVPRRLVWRFGIIVGGTFLVLCLLYLGVGWLDRAQFRPAIGFLQLLADLPDRFVPVGFLRVETIQFLPTAPLSRFVYQWIGPAFWIVLLLSALPLFFSDRAVSRFAERDRVLALLRRGSGSQGGGSLGQLATWTGNDYWFSSDGSVAIAYRVRSGVAITTADPIGDPAGVDAAIREFATFCDDNGWIPVLYSVSDDFAKLFRSMGWSTMVVAEETVVRPAAWTMKGKSFQDIRSSINRAEREGLTAVWTTWAKLTLAQAAQIEAISESWVAEKRMPELGFTLGGLDELRDPGVALLIAVGDDDVIDAVTSWMPIYRDDELVGWTLDFMRRRPNGMNGVMEFLIASAALLMQQRGIETMSLSAAPLARRPGEADDGATERLLAFLSRSLEPAYGFQSLFAFKQKFKPELRPLLMAYPDPLALPAIGTALARAYLPTLTVRQTVAMLRRG